MTDHKKEQIYLTDYNPDDKKWDDHKSAVDKISFYYSTSAEEKHKKYGNRVYDCAELLRFNFIDNLATGETKLKLTNASFCRVRLCPVCQWRRSMAWRARLFQNLPRLFEEHKNLNFLFLTLTVKNCEIDDLSNELKKLNSAWKKLIDRKIFKDSIKGYIRATEVTKSGDQAHPHFHCILAVGKSYFKNNYISQARWVELWQSCLNVDYVPVVDVRKIKQTGTEIETKAVVETLKYTTKIQDLLEDQTWFLKLTDQLHNKRFLATGGIFKDILKEEVTGQEMLCLENGEDEEQEQEEKLKSALYFSFEHQVKKYKKVKNPHQ